MLTRVPWTHYSLRALSEDLIYSEALEESPAIFLIVGVEENMKSLG